MYFTPLTEQAVWSGKLYSSKINVQATSTLGKILKELEGGKNYTNLGIAPDHLLSFSSPCSGQRIFQ